MNNATNILANIIVEGAIDFMAAKANTTAKAIAEAIVANPAGNTARYLAELVATGVRNADSILAGREVTAETIQ